METRELIQAKVYKLQLNPVFGRCEDHRIVAISTDLNRLVDWYKQFQTEMYYDDDESDRERFGHCFRKSFTKGSPIEYYNPIHNLEPMEEGGYGDGIYAEWVDLEFIQRLSGFAHDYEIVCID